MNQTATTPAELATWTTARLTRRLATLTAQETRAEEVLSRARGRRREKGGRVQSLAEVRATDNVRRVGREVSTVRQELARRN